MFTKPGMAQASKGGEERRFHSHSRSKIAFRLVPLFSFLSHCLFRPATRFPAPDALCAMSNYAFARSPHPHFSTSRQVESPSIWKSVKDDEMRPSITPELAPLPSAKAGELAAKFDIVTGYTPAA